MKVLINKSTFRMFLFNSPSLIHLIPPADSPYLCRMWKWNVKFNLKYETETCFLHSIRIWRRNACYADIQRCVWVMFFFVLYRGILCTYVHTTTFDSNPFYLLEDFSLYAYCNLLSLVFIYKKEGRRDVGSSNNFKWMWTSLFLLANTRYTCRKTSL